MKRSTEHNFIHGINAKAARAISLSFLKNSLMQINSKLNAKLWYVERMGIILFEFMAQVENLLAFKPVADHETLFCQPSR